MRCCLAGRAALLLAIHAALAKPTAPPRANAARPSAGAAAAAARALGRAPPPQPRGDQAMPPEALLFQSPLTCTIAAIDWARRLELSPGWARGVGLVSTGSRGGMIGGVPRICVMVICLIMTALLIMTLWSIVADRKDTLTDEEFPLRRGDKFAGPMGRPGVAPGAVPPICPKLMLPHGAAQFRIPMDSIRKLRSGTFPIEVYGSSKDPLLHAWLPRLGSLAGVPTDDCSADAGCGPAGRAAPTRGQGLWLQLTTTSTCRHPHACVGPLYLRGMSAVEQPEAVQILGPGGARYGTFQPSEDSWRVMCNGIVVLTVTTSLPFPHLSALDSKGHPVASAGQQRWSIMGTDALIVQVSQGSDALLALLCMLAVVLVSVDLAVPPMKLPALGSSRNF
uniref:Uncharacterized protein n=1 Tax=Alexandrium monilatum TaxID=311494 RepID=A0A7S4SAH9_9DINO